MTDSYFQSVGSGVSPFSHAHAPCGNDMLHGRFLGGLAGWLLLRPTLQAPVFLRGNQRGAAIPSSAGVVVFDDAALFTSWRQPFSRYRTAKRHPGRSRVANQVGFPFREILRVAHNRAFLKVA